MNQTLSKFKAELGELEARLNKSPSLPVKEQGQLFKRISELKRMVGLEERISTLKQTISEHEELIKKIGEDQALQEMAREELPKLKEQLKKAEEDLKVALSPADQLLSHNALLEIRAGTGGEEAAIFASDLARMYSRFLENGGFKIETLSKSESEAGEGLKEIVLRVKGPGAYHKLRYESGVHRVQRVPVTESKGRIHTSTATVAVLPEAEEKDVVLGPKDLKIETFRASSHGGQSVNTTDSAVRITHLPTGITVAVQDERSQSQNKEKALTILRHRLLAHQLEEEERALALERRGQIGSGERSEKIRTYNFPQNRITDHRLNKSWHNLEEVLSGKLNEIIQALQETQG